MSTPRLTLVITPAPAGVIVHQLHHGVALCLKPGPHAPDTLGSGSAVNCPVCLSAARILLGEG